MHDRPLTLDDYRASRWIVEPFHVFDCCLVSNGGLAVIVTSAERARALRKPPVYVLGHGAGSPGRRPERHAHLGRGARAASRRSPWRASRSRDVDVVELYDCYTFTVLVTLEDYGFCAKGEGGAVRRRAPHRAGRPARAQHRRRPALELLHVGHDAGVGGGDPAARRGRRAPGRRSTTSRSCPATAASSRPTRRSCSRGSPCVSDAAPHAPCRPSRRRWRRSGTRPAGTSSSAQRCLDCGAFRFPAREVCSRCLSRARRVAAGVGPRARVQRRGHAPGEPPVVRGPRAVRRGRRRARRGRPHDLDRRRGSTRTAIAIGMPVEVDFEDVTPEISLPVFRPAAG